MGGDPIMDDLDAALARLRVATTPVETAMARIEIAFCNWALRHDITERLFGNPDWYRHRWPCSR